MNNFVNTVPGSDQLKNSDYITHYPNPGAKKAVIIGNSITRHGPKADIGWNNDWGMAASAKEKDYVHLLKAKLEDKFGGIDLCVVQGSRWEIADSKDKAGCLAADYQAVPDFAPELLIVRIGENIDFSKTDAKTLLRDWTFFMEFLGAERPGTQVILTGLFWGHPEKESVICAIAENFNYTYVKLDDLGADDKMTAKGLFEHEGVAGHPGDLGMQNICDRIFEAIK